MQQRDELFLAEIVAAAEQAILLAADITAEDLQADRQRRDALLWNFTVLGEGASQLSDEFKMNNPDINFARPSRLRNRIVHGYWSIDLDVLIHTATEDLPRFVAHLRAARAT